MLKYEVKVYDRLGNFKSQINPKNIVGDIAYSDEIDGGQSNLTLSIIWNWEDYKYSDIVEIREVSDEYRTIKWVYTGVVNSLSIVEFENEDQIEIELLGIFTILNNIEFSYGWSKKVTMNGTAGQIMKYIIDSHQTEYTTLSGDTQVLDWYPIRYTSTSIDTSGASLSIKFDADSCLDALKKCAENSGMHWHIGCDGVVYYGETAWDKRLTFQREIIAISKTLSGNDMKNKITFINGYTYIDVNWDPQEGKQTTIYQDATSISSFGIHEDTVEDTTVRSISAWWVKANAMISENNSEKDETVITVKRPIVISPNMHITTQNTKIPIENKRVERIEWRRDTVSIYLGSYLSFWREITWK